MDLDPLEFLVAFLPSEKRKLTRTGVEIHRLQYWGDALAQWIGQHKDVSVHYDPRDITVVYVRSPGGVVIRCQVTTPNIPAISLAEWQARRNYEVGLTRDPARVAISDSSLKRNDQLISQAKASRRVRRRRATEAAGDAFRARPSPTATPIPKAAITHEASEPAGTGAIVANLIYEVDSYE